MPDREMHVELEALKSDISDLRSDLGQFFKAAKHNGHSRVAAVGGRIRDETANRLAQLREALENAKDYGQKAYHTAHRKVEQKPVTSVLTAFAIGMAVGRLLMGRRR